MVNKAALIFSHFLLISALLLFPFIKTSSLCEQLIKESQDDTSLSLKLSTKMHNLKYESTQCVESLLRSGNFSSLETFLTELNKRGIKFRETLSAAINTIQRKLEDLHNKFKFDEADFQRVTPAFQWAQSMTHLYLEIKFAHRHDSPGCLEVKDQTVEIYKSMVIYKAFCVLGDVPIRFDLNLNMFTEVSAEESTHGSGSVGRYHITLKKKTAGMYWDRLLLDPNDNPSNMKVWFEMREKYIGQIQQYIDDDEEEEFKRRTEEIEKEVRGNKKRKKKKNKEPEEKSEL